MENASCGRLPRAVLVVLAVVVVVLAGRATEAGAAAGNHAAGAGTGATPPAVGRELAGLRTERSRTWARPDGVRVTRVFDRPVNTRTAAGAWAPIDHRLRRSGGDWVNGDAAYDVAIPTSLGDGPTEIAHDGHRIGMALRGADVVAAVDGAAASFAGVSEGVTARWTVASGALKEELVLADAGAASSFTFDVSLSSGLRLRDLDDGSIVAEDGRGTVAFSLAAPFAFDASGSLAPADAVTMRSARSGDGWAIRLQVARSWLDDGTRAFPVTVDPTVAPGPATDCHLNQGAPTTSHCASDDILVGHDAVAGLQDHRGLVRFDLDGVVPGAANVLSADLHLWARTSGSAAIDAYRVTQPWTGDATWNAREVGTPWTTPGGDHAADAFDAVGPPSGSTWSAFSVGNLVRSWQEGSQPNHGVLLKARNLPSSGMTAFASSEYHDDSRWPHLEIWWLPRTGAMADYTLDEHAISDRQQLGVNVAGGNLLLSATDLQIAGRGLNLSIDRFYNLGDDESPHGQTGEASRLSVGSDIKLFACDDHGSMCFQGPSGYYVVFTRAPGGGDFQTPPGINARLVRNAGGTYTMTFNRTGVRYEFSAAALPVLTDIVDRNGNRIHMTYSSGRLIEIEDTQGREIDVSHDAAGLVSEIEDPVGRTWRYEYDGWEALERVTDPEGGATEYRYDGDRRLVELIDGRGHSTHVTYDSAGRVSEVRREIDGTPTRDVTTTYSYAGPTTPCVAGTDVGKTIVIDPLGRDTTYCWNAKGQVTKVRDALGRDATQTFTPNGDAADYTSFVGTGNPALTTQVYDADDNLRSRTAPAGERQSWTAWSAASNPADPLRRYRTQSYTDAQGADTFYGYDDAGNVTDVKDAATSPVNQATLAYNADGTLRTATDGNGNTTTFGYDGVGNLISVDPAGPVLPTTYAYDAVGRVDSVTDGRGETLEYGYDALDRVITVSAEDGSYVYFAYDQNGNLEYRDDWPWGNTTHYSYDKLNRRLGEDFSGGGDNVYAYDKAGNMTSLTDPSGVVRYAYDDVRRVRTIVSPRPGGGTDTVTYSYADPAAGRPFSRRTAALPGGATQIVDRDLSGKVIDVLLRNSANATVVRRLTDYGAGAAERSLVQTLTTEGGATTSYAYADTTQDVGRLMGTRTVDASLRTLGRNVLAYDRAGNRTLLTTTNASGVSSYTQYAYNAANQLCWIHYARSANGCASPPAGAAAVFGYDAAGNQLTGDHAMAWDRYGRLAQLDGTALAHLGPGNGELVGFGRQALGNNLFGLSRVVDGATTTSIVRNPDTGEAVSQTVGSEKRWYTHNHLGSTLALSNATGGLARAYSYSIDGVDSSTGSGSEALLGFAGGHRLPAGTLAGPLYHYGARFYDTATGRWSSLDPILQPASLRAANRYEYVGGDPINHVDPSGLIFLDDAWEWVKSGAKNVSRVGSACYIANAWVDEEDSIKDELRDLNECYNPLNWTDDIIREAGGG